ncbi:DNA-processing protein DprA [Neptuniibacter caesariensis]|uniref:DNA processing chain A n=1 Tax=Neptuniibacter caesariensis TaxID=207954 RepID=A0A7U8GU46_NEPCE|nr:DNA-processing protein DprA [Neptuniibacter caesariensis]EAR62800.1 DNA processing chain A [Oceanospirillum sp. MED92] [Neptuniibacter caesariensis]
MTNQDYWRNETVAFLALSELKGVGYWTLYKLSCKNISFKKILKEYTKEELESLLGIKIKLPSDTGWDEFCIALWESGIEALRSLHAQKVLMIFHDQDSFPESLKDLADGPRWLFVQGKLENLSKKSVAVVGTRKPTDDGVFLTKYFVAALSEHSLLTVSGLAYGIDQITHLESLRYGIPTVAVLGTGILQNYPKGSEEIRLRIVSEGGTIVSEYLPNQSYSGENFVRRNRIQAALSTFVVPVEWKIKSGTAHTVEFANRYQRKIINIFLPSTYGLREELSFSESKYNAISVEIPKEHAVLKDLLQGDHASSQKLLSGGHQTELEL